jgi:hypothetical protein
MVFPKIGINRFRIAAAIILFSLSAAILSSCQKDTSHPRSYPQVTTSAVTNISEQGATFSADIFSLGSETIIEHGFVWGEGYNPDLSKDRILLGATDVPGKFTTEISSTLGKNIEYSVKAFVKTAEHTVYGEVVKFVSLGSEAPVVYSFSPDSAAWLDTIKITGKNFSLDHLKNKVSLNDVQCPVLSATDTTLLFTVSQDLSQLKSLVHVEISGNGSVFTGDTLKLKAPVLTGFSPAKAYWGDTLYVYGKHFRSYSMKATNYVKLGGYNCTRFGQLNDTMFKILVPGDISTLQCGLDASINGIALHANSNFELKPPVFTISPLHGTWGTVVTMEGRLNPNPSRNKIYFSGVGEPSEIYQENIVSTSAKSIKVKVPLYITQFKTVLKYESAPFSIVSADTFRLDPPTITSFSPVSGPSGTLVSIRGKNLGTYNLSVLFGQSGASVLSTSDTLVKAYVPQDLSGNNKITISVAGQSAVSSGYFNVTNPIVSQVTPLTGTFNDLVTISGQNFSLPGITPVVYFEWSLAEVVSFSNNTIVTKVPVYLDNSPKRMTVVIGSNVVYSNDLFTLMEPQISSISPSTLTLGSTLILTGTGFNPEASRNKVSWNTYELPILSASATSISVSIPANLPSGTGTILLECGGYKILSSLSYEIKSPWTEFKVYGVGSNSGYSMYDSNITFSLNGQGYFMGTTYPVMYRYTPGVNTFENIGYFDQFYYASSLSTIICNDTVYTISNSKGLYRFDVPSLTWIKITDTPVTDPGGVAFSLNGKIYWGLAYGDNISKFWIYNPIYKNWILRNPFPENTDQIPIAFSINNLGYVLFYDNKFFSYDPVTDRWTQRSSYPGSGNHVFGRTAFTLNNQGYVGGGRDIYSDVAYTDFYSYNPSTDTWTQEVPIPGMGKFNSVSFSINNLGYVGFGATIVDGSSVTQAVDFYQFDPASAKK